MSWNLLERFIESEHFNKDPSLTVAYLAYANLPLQSGANSQALIALTRS
jgi:hypothetical protein